MLKKSSLAMKKFMAIMLALTLVLSSMAITAVADEAATPKHECDQATFSDGLHYACDVDKLEGGYQAPTCEEDGFQKYTCNHCGETITETADNTKQDPNPFKKLGHTPAKNADTSFDGTVHEGACNATCYQEGKKWVSACANCGEEYFETIEKKQHDHQIDETLSTPAKCGVNAVNVFVCQNEGCGDTYSEELEGTALKHKFEGTTTKNEFTAPTCEEPGQILLFKECTREGCDVFNDIADYSQYLEALDHKAVMDKLIADALAKYPEDADKEEKAANDIVKAAGKTGIITTQVVTEDPYNVLPTAPVYTVVEYEAPNCVETGLLTLSCEDCGKSATLEIPANGHDYVFSAIKNVAKPTCLENGKLLVTCSVKDLKDCNFEEQVDVIAPKKHNMDKDLYVYTQELFTGVVTTEDKTELVDCVPYTVQEKCGGHKVTVYFKDGSKTSYSIKCDYISDPVDMPATGEHDKSTNHAYEPSTCIKHGKEAFYCKDCKYSYSNIELPLVDHIYEFEVVTEPGCDTDGLIVWTCEVEGCEYYDEQIVPMTGHNYKEDEDKYVAADCKKEQDEVIVEVCAYCGDVATTTNPYTHTAPKKVDGTEQYSSYEAPTCTTNGNRTYQCTECHEYIENETIPAKGHRWDRDTKHTQFTIPYEGAKEEYVGEYYDTHEAATCTELEYYSRYCKDCKTTETVTEGEFAKHQFFRTDKDGNKTVLNFVINTSKLPTCTSEGEATFNCANEKCGALVTYTLPKLACNHVTHWDEESRAYVVECVKTADASSAAWKAALKNYDLEITDPAEAKKVKDEVTKLLKLKTTEYVYGIGHGIVETLPVNKTHYTVTEKDGIVSIELDDKAIALNNPMIRVTWCYTMSDGNMFSYTRYVKPDADGTFDIGEAATPNGGELNRTMIFVVDQKGLTAGEAHNLGYGELKK